jgi:hypothetical protein
VRLLCVGEQAVRIQRWYRALSRAQRVADALLVQDKDLDT